jgi:hypothetical protein
VDDNTLKAIGLATPCFAVFALAAGFALIIWVVDGCRNPFRRRD